MLVRPNMCLSGGADGADVVWGMAAEAAEIGRAHV